MIEPETENGSPALDEAARELRAAQHDAQVAFDCIALGGTRTGPTRTRRNPGRGGRGGDRAGGGARPGGAGLAEGERLQSSASNPAPKSSLR